MTDARTIFIVVTSWAVPYDDCDTMGRPMAFSTLDAARAHLVAEGYVESDVYARVDGVDGPLDASACWSWTRRDVPSPGSDPDPGELGTEVATIRRVELV